MRQGMVNSLMRVATFYDAAHPSLSLIFSFPSVNQLKVFFNNKNDKSLIVINIKRQATSRESREPTKGRIMQHQVPIDINRIPIVIMNVNQLREVDQFLTNHQRVPVAEETLSELDANQIPIDPRRPFYSREKKTRSSLIQHSETFCTPDSDRISKKDERLPQVYVADTPLPSREMAALNDSEQQEYLASLQQEFEEIKQAYENLHDAERKETAIKLRCSLWVLNGIMHHGIDRVQLEQVAKKYANLGLVPQGYQQPDLYLRTKPTPSNELLASVLSFERI